MQKSAINPSTRAFGCICLLIAATKTKHEQENLKLALKLDGGSFQLLNIVPVRALSEKKILFLRLCILLNRLFSQSSEITDSISP